VSVAAAPIEMGRLLRAARRARAVSQRELAALAQVPRSTIDRIEADRVRPRIETVAHLLDALGFRFAVTDSAGRVLVLDDEHDRLCDAAGRRFPAHLVWSRTPSWRCWTGNSWWGWWRIAWPFGVGVPPPAYTYWRRQNAVPKPWPSDSDRMPDGLGLDEGVEPG
jgi:transcriptional regulator with XRE-family HTH domain